jgi:hypothetical protein
MSTDFKSRQSSPLIVHSGIFAVLERGKPARIIYSKGPGEAALPDLEASHAL